MVTDILQRLFAEILEEANENANFRRKLEIVLESSSIVATNRLVSTRRNRRAPAVLDPFKELQESGEDNLRKRLAGLSIDQLKDIVSQHAMDSSHLALKWRSPERLTVLILTVARSRLQKGDAFIGNK
jgi:hypothetical protein